MIGAHVLVVEDDATIAEEVRAELSAHGYTVSVATTGRRGLELAEEVPPALVLLDLGLPDLDGVQLCRTLRAQLATVPIVIVTARDADIDIVVGLDAGASDYVTKPFSTSVLLARVRAHLRNDTGAPRTPTSPWARCGSMSRPTAPISTTSSWTCGRRSSPSCSS